MGTMVELGGASGARTSKVMRLAASGCLSPAVGGSHKEAAAEGSWEG